MFTSHNIDIHAELDQTVIRATLRPQDLIPAFLEVIRETPEYLQIINSNNYAVITDAGADEYDERWESEDISYLLNEELFDILNHYAPDGYYFGSIEGDGSDFGFWNLSEWGFDDF